MKVKVRYFALLREERGLAEETLPHEGTAGELYDRLHQEHGFRLGRDRVRVAVNGEFAEHDRTLRDGDEVVFVPPVAGG
jgi:sulfur-carrier protein